MPSSSRLQREAHGKRRQTDQRTTLNVKSDNQLRLGGVYFGEKTPRALVDFYLKNGFSAAFDPNVEDEGLMAEILAAFKQADIVIAETPAFGINIADPNDELREANLDRICRRLERAEKVGARCCVGHGGTPNTPQMWQHNPDNFSQANIDRCVDGIQRILDAVRPQHTKFVIETESRILPDSPEIYLAMIEAVDRPGFAVHLDPVNIISSPRRFYFSGDFIRDCFDKLGPYITSCHAKDSQMVPGKQTHFEEVPPGDGDMDYATYLTELVGLGRDVPLLFEHFAEEDQNRAREYVYAQAAALGIPVRNSEHKR
jgi:sugar phosphate isomerase/epimerase